MKLKKCSVIIDEKPFIFEVEGSFFWGEPTVLYQKENSVLDKVPWEKEGYKVVKILENKIFLTLQQSIKKFVGQAIESVGIIVDNNKFTLEKYHEYIKTQENHLKVINITRNLTIEDLDFDIENLIATFEKELKCKLTSWIEGLQKSHIQIRISRPNSLDINPPHRDGYLSFFENIINIWIPIAGCNAQTSLPVLPKSHLMSENKILRTQAKGAKINGNIYNVPCLLKSSEGLFEMIRPNPQEGEALIFTPYLIHGAAINQTQNTTRVALELRFPKIN